MRASELKADLIKTIANLEDIDLLKYIQSIIHKTNEDILYFSYGQKKIIEIARNQFVNGDFLDNESAEQDIEKWLS